MKMTYFLITFQVKKGGFKLVADIQSYFDRFHRDIRLSYDNSSNLREKRDLLISNLSEGLQRLSRIRNISLPRCEAFDQGSYAMSTGVMPLPGEDYDIDIGLSFKLSTGSYGPTEVKSWVHDALNTGNRTVEYKRPCVRVQYHKNGQKDFHVDLAVYSDAEYNWTGNYYLAKGFIGSLEEYKIWEVSEPFRLKKMITEGSFQSLEDRRQLRRVIRYLKRWKDVNFSSSGHERPTGIALTACALNWFQPVKHYLWNGSSYYYSYDDLTATTNLVQSIISSFAYQSRLTVHLPVKPYNNLFEKMSNNQIQGFKNKLITLTDALIYAKNTTDSTAACSCLQLVFGSDFPKP